MKKHLFTIIVILIGVLIPVSAFAHGGGTDSSGGHKDNKNASGLGSYHYHHGYGPHLHNGGVCPYAATVSTPQPQTRSANNDEIADEPAPEPTVALVLIQEPTEAPIATLAPVTKTSVQTKAKAAAQDKADDKKGGGAWVTLLVLGGLGWLIYKKRKKA